MMTDFNEAYKITMSYEGGYADNPNDHGGETWRGIARNFWPNWPGWEIVDHIHAQHPANLNQALKDNIQLEPMVMAFYQIEFWDSLSLTAVNYQKIANQLFDISVNMGTAMAARLLQTAINTFTNNSLKVDEIIGANTIAATNSMDQKALYNKINEFRKGQYEQIIINNPSQAIFKDNWFSRINHLETIGRIWLNH